VSVSPLHSDTESESKSTPPLYHSPPHCAASPSSVHPHKLSSHTLLTPPPTDILPPAGVRPGDARICTVTCSARRPLDARHAHKLEPHPIAIHMLALTLHHPLQALLRCLHCTCAACTCSVRQAATAAGAAHGDGGDSDGDA